MKITGNAIRNAKAGFTLIEVLVVIAIIGILAAVTVPLAGSFIRMGEEASRNNVARTIYVGMQNHLTTGYVEGSLRSTLTEFYYENTSSDDFDASYGKRVATELGSDFPDTDDNKPNVRYISKPRGYTPGPFENTELSAFYYMLSSIVSGEDLDAPILMEYNVRTGIVMSVFIGYTNEHSEFFHQKPSPPNPLSSLSDLEWASNPNNIGGPRADGYIDTAIDRRQGYHGVESTGVWIPEVNLDLGESIFPPAPVEKDAYGNIKSPNLPGPGPGESIPGTGGTVSFSTFNLPKQDPMPSYTYELVNAITLAPITSSDSAKYPTSITITDFSAVDVGFSGIERIYRTECGCHDGTTNTCGDCLTCTGGAGCTSAVTVSDGEGGFTAVKCNPNFSLVWITDYIQGDLNSLQSLAIGDGTSVSYISPQYARVKVTNNENGKTAVSSRFHTHFASEGESTGRFGITEIKHLNNMRYFPDRSYRQTADIDAAAQGITVFKPVGGVFSGRFSATKNVTEFFYIKNLTSTGTAGLFTTNAGTVTGVALINPIVNSAGAAGAIAEVNNGTIDMILIQDAEITGAGFAGGVTAMNNGLINNNRVIGTRTADIVPSSTFIKGTDAGGIAGTNSGTIQKSGVEDIDVIGQGGTGAGGFTSDNMASGIISDVYFTATTRSDKSPVSNAGTDASGGIAANNAGTIARAMYLAPAPRDGSGPSIRFYPIARSGDTSGTNCFYLAGYSYSVTNGASFRFPESSGNYHSACSDCTGGSCLMPDLYYNSAKGIGTDGGNYNAGSVYEMNNGFEDTVYIRGVIGSLDHWVMTSERGSVFPYPILSTMSSSNFLPQRWTEADEPVASDQLDRDMDLFSRRTADSILPLYFINGDFNAPVKFPENHPTNAYQEYPLFGSSYTLNAAQSGNRVTGSQTIQISQGWFIPTTRTAGISFNAPTVAVGDSQTYTTGEVITRRYPFIVRDWSAGNSEANNFNHGGFYAYYWHDYIQGWTIRPTTTGGFSNTYWNVMEFQRPNTSATNGRARVGYNGLDRAYAELNADVQGTLYQICNTNPGQTFFYSFHHQTRTTGTATDSMSFFLSPIGDGKQLVETPAELNARDANRWLIRPCNSPRTNTSASTSNPNPNVRNSVAYGRGFGSDMQRYWDNSRSHWSAGKPSPFAGVTDWSNVYIYDVWVGDTSTGYGITFWSHSNLSVATNGSNTAIPTAGITQTQYNNNQWTWVAAAKTNTFAYWGAANGWKQYYGEYTVPADQTRTEFAFQSNSGTSTEGNYLAGITFDSDAFLTIDKSVKHAGSSEVSYDQMFAKPGNELEITLELQSWGDIAASRIVITDDLWPYTEYFDFNASSLTIRKGGTVVNNAVVSYPTIGTVTPPDNPGNQVLRITMPTTGANATLAKGETLTVSFRVTVRGTCRTTTAPTLHYYFRNQANIEYGQDVSVTGFRGMATAALKTNQSNIINVNIDPIVLNKTITGGNPAGSLVDGPFEVTLTITNESGDGSSVRNGIITDKVPNGFRVTGVTRNGAPVSVRREFYSGGSSLLTIQDDDALSAGATVTYKYTLEYSGFEYGTSLNTETSFKYMYETPADGDNPRVSRNVKSNFPSRAVGLSVKTEEIEHSADGAALLNNSIFGTSLLNVFRNGSNFALNGNGQPVTPRVYLCDEDGNPLGLLENGNSATTTAQYRVFMDGATLNIEFTPYEISKNATYKLYYKVELRVNNPGGNPASFNLDSAVTPIIIHYTGTNLLVYYEEYEEGGYGFFTANIADLPNVVSSLDNTKIIKNSGYGVLSGSTSKQVQIDGADASVSRATINGLQLYKINNVSASDNLALRTVTFGNVGTMTELGSFHPSFAKAVYATGVSNAGNSFAIRTPQQMLGIGSLTDTTGLTFTQERALDFGNALFNGAAIQGEFKGTYNGGNHGISHMVINGNENVGLFSINSGTINNIVLNAPATITGTKNVGGITGHNLSTITGCTVHDDVMITGNENVGRIFGFNGPLPAEDED